MLDKPFTNPFAASFIVLPSTDSTNNYALSAIRQDMAGHGSAFFALEQTAGKGQMGRKWQSEKDANIALSVVLQPGVLPISAQFQLSACVALAVQQFLTTYTGADDTRIKWPNDLYWKDRKLGGILIESIIGSGGEEQNSQSWKWAVAGIGINVNQSSFQPDLPNPVSLKQITGKEFDVVELASELHAYIIEYFCRLLQKGFGDIFIQYNASLYKLNEPVKLKKESRVFSTTIKGVSSSGQLVCDSNGIEERFEFGEINWFQHISI